MSEKDINTVNELFCLVDDLSDSVVQIARVGGDMIASVDGSKKTYVGMLLAVASVNNEFANAIHEAAAQLKVKNVKQNKILS